MTQLSAVLPGTDQVEPLDWPLDVNLADHLLYRHVREGRGARAALLYNEDEVSYVQLSDSVRRGAAVLDKMGCRPGDRVLIILPDSPSFVIAFFAALHVGAIAVPVNPALSKDDVLDLAERIQPKLTVVHHGVATKFRNISEAGYESITAGDCVNEVQDLELAIESIGTHTKSPLFEKELTAYILFSSGTTGKPKGIPHRHTDILECIRAYSIPILQMSATDIVLAVPKLTFGYGLGGNLLSSLYVGAASILIPEQASRDLILERASHFKPTLFLGQPRMIADILRNGSTEPFASLRLAVSAGEVLAPALYELWRSVQKVELLDGFGSTEVGHVFISNTVGDVQLACSGRVLDPFEVKIIDEAGIEVTNGAIGHLWVSGPSVAKEYWNDPVRTAHSFSNEWVRTGDLFYQDSNGYLYASGRADDMIKAGCGQWIAPTEIENILQEDPDVVEAAVVGYTDQLGIVRPRAIIVHRQNARPTAELEARLRLLIENRFPELPHKHLGQLEFATSLPKSPTGKLQRFMLRPASLTEFSYHC